jgi:pimeloyl-ACP methyl ester carboxylesterase
MEPTARRRLGRLAIVPGAILAGLLLGAGLSVVTTGGWEQWLSARGFVPGYGDRGAASTALEGRRLYLDCRGSGSPTVVLEAGMGMDARSWGSVFPEVARITRACTYSRANRWGSDPRGEHTLREAVADLRAALDAAGEDGPFVLVAHSLGDVYARVFAGAYPADVAGLVLVDPFAPDLFRGLIARAPPALAARWQANLDGNIQAVEATERLDWTRSESELASVTLGDLPVELVVVPQPFATDRHIPDRDREPLRAAWVAGMEGLSTLSRITTAPGSGHMIQWDRPALVGAAIRRMIDLARGD